MTYPIKAKLKNLQAQFKQMTLGIINQDAFKAIQDLNEELSKRFIALDPKGYFLIRLDELKREIIVEHYQNDIDHLGRAIDAKTGKPIRCNNEKRTPIQIFKGRSAKEVGVQLTEGDKPYPISKLDHALYLGRELQRAEDCLVRGKPYIQD